MPDANDMELLRDYARHGSETAFAELVQRHIGLVYSAALRHVGIAAQAEEITQAVFIILARKVSDLRPDTILEGWLYETTRLTSLSFLRGERRRQFREQEAYMQSTLNEPADDAVWNQLSPLLDEAMAHLGKKDRDAVILRFFKEKSVRDVAASLQVNEAAAQRRILRALEKLRKFFTKRGVSSTTAIIAGVISANSVQAAPMTLAKSVTAVAITKGAAASGSTLTLMKGALKIMAWIKVKTAIVVGVGILFAAGTATVTVKEIAAHRTPAWQEKFDLSLLDGLPPQVKILPSLPSTVYNRTGERNGKVLAMGQSFMALLETAYQVVQSRLIVNAPIPEGKYDFITTYPRMNDNLEALQEEIRKRFGVVVRREMIETNVLILTVQSPNAPGLKTSAGQFSNQAEPGFYAIHGATLYTLVADLEVNLGTVIIDETRLRGKFDIDFKWDLTPDGLKRVLRDEFGLELTPARKIVEFIVVDKAN